MTDNSIGLILKATQFAADKHRNQRRKDAEASPYINHPIALANVLANEGGITDHVVLCGALLHDTIEDTETTADELRAVFGDEITAVVLDVTDDKSIKDKQKRKELQVEHAPHISRDIASSPPADWPKERKTAYFDWAARVIAGVRGTHSGLEAIFDQTYALKDTV